MTCQLCPKPVRSRGYCSLHYRRLMKHGNPEWSYYRSDVPKTFKGNGKLSCEICGRAYRDHEVTETCL